MLGLLNYPEVIEMMNKDLEWTQSLGDAVINQQKEVLAAIQSFRKKAQGAGNLQTNEKQVVVVEKEVIKIVSADPQVITNMFRLLFVIPQHLTLTWLPSGLLILWIGFRCSQ